jgi:hypothetical protein
VNGGVTVFPFGLFPKQGGSAKTVGLHVFIVGVLGSDDKGRLFLVGGMDRFHGVVIVVQGVAVEAMYVDEQRRDDRVFLIQTAVRGIANFPGSTVFADRKGVRAGTFDRSVLRNSGADGQDQDQDAGDEVGPHEDEDDSGLGKMFNMAKLRKNDATIGNSFLSRV